MSLTKQDVFDIALTHIRQQGKPSVALNEDGTMRELYEDCPICLYRGDGGLQCAAAPLITKYDPQMDNHEYSSDISFSSIYADFGPDHFIEGLTHPLANFASRELQVAHDRSAKDQLSGRADFLEAYEERMRRIAEAHDLEYSEPA